MKIVFLLVVVSLLLIVVFVIHILLYERLSSQGIKKIRYYYDVEAQKYKRLRRLPRARIVLVGLYILSLSSTIYAAVTIIFEICNPELIEKNEYGLFVYNYRSGSDNYEKFSADIKRVNLLNEKGNNSGTSYLVTITDLGDTLDNPEHRTVLYYTPNELKKDFSDTGSVFCKALFSIDSNRLRPKKKVEIAKGSFKKILIKSDKRWGEIQMFIDSVMYLGRGHKALLVITKARDTVQSNATWEKLNPGKSVMTDFVDSIPNYTEVVASLFPAGGEEYFKITPSEVQKNTFNLSKDKSLAFQWIVSPMKRGYNDVSLQVRYKELLKGKQGPPVPEKIYTVYVKANEMSRSDSILYWVKEYQVLLSITGAILAFIIVNIIRRKRGDD